MIEETRFTKQAPNGRVPVGVVSFVYPDSKNIFGIRTQQVSDILQAGNRMNVPTYAFRPEDIDFTSGRVKRAYFINPQGQFEYVHDVPLPATVIMKRRSPKGEKWEEPNSSFLETLGQHATLLNPPGWGTLARDKDWVGKVLAESKVSTPAHELFKDADQVADWAGWYGKVFLKPQLGTWGKGQIVVGKRKDGRFFLRYRDKEGWGKPIHVHISRNGLGNSIQKAFERIGFKGQPYMVQAAVQGAQHFVEREVFNSPQQVAALAAVGPVVLDRPAYKTRSINGHVVLDGPNTEKPNPVTIHQGADGRFNIQYYTPWVNGYRYKRKIVTSKKQFAQTLKEVIKNAGHETSKLHVTGRNTEGPSFSIRVTTALDEKGKHQIAGIVVQRGRSGEDVSNQETEVIHPYKETLEETFGKKATTVDENVRKITTDAIQAIDRKLIEMGKTPLGHTCVEMMVDRKGQPQVLEFNSMPMTGHLAENERQRFGQLQIEACQFIHQRYGK